ncbi:hypothetical protein [Motilibacter deserti]|uniref:Dolichyl-phosphate-mannose-protein mannosyltransferase n=1 Tax=Motilibacter deserti TaxID=2714956 RepID=A0ABX0GZI1_9ACTN|nr:hypothetical protein [Motilibacter deserti]NHC16222.1 hypothetical protein [Motilibacter deserti]
MRPTGLSSSGDTGSVDLEADRGAPASSAARRLTGKRLLAWALLSVVLAISFGGDPLRVTDPGYHRGFDAVSEGLVRMAIDQAPDRPAFGPMPTSTALDSHYIAQFGLQGDLAGLTRPGGLGGAEWADFLRWVLAASAGAVFAAAAVAVGVVAGRLAAGAAVVALVLSPWLLAFAPNLYWATVLLIAPCVAVGLIYRRDGSRRRTLTAAAVMALLVLVKCLCGYEFVTTVVLGGVAGVAFHEFAGRVDRRLLGRLAAFTVVGIVGFGVALMLHSYQLSHTPGLDPSMIEGRSSDRTFNPENIDFHLQEMRDKGGRLSDLLLQVFPDPVALALNKWKAYAMTTLVAPPGAGFSGVDWHGTVQLPLIVFMLFVLYRADRVLRRRKPTSPAENALLGTALIGLAGGWSWLVLGFGHAINHAHLDAIVFYLPFVPATAALAAIVLAETLRRRSAGEPAADQAPAAGDPAHARA